MSKKPEKVAERKFARKVEANGGDAIKLSMQGPYGRRGRNDRLVLMPGRVIALFEFKKEGEDPTKLQLFMHRKYRKMGIPVYVVYTCEEAWDFLEVEIRKQLRSTEVPKGMRKVRAE